MPYRDTETLILILTVKVDWVVGVHTFSLSTWEGDVYEFGASLVYTASSRTVGATSLFPVASNVSPETRQT